MSEYKIVGFVTRDAAEEANEELDGHGVIELDRPEGYPGVVIDADQSARYLTRSPLGDEAERIEALL